MPEKAVPTYARQLVKPFWRLMRRYPQFPSAAVDQLEAEAPERMPVAEGQKLLQATVEATGEPNLGLLAANETEVGAFDVLEYVAFSAPNWRAGIETAFRYSHLMNEAAAFRLEEAGDKARIILHSTVPLTRAGIDFQSAAFYVAVKRWLSPAPPELEVHFAYPEPEDITQHRKTFDDRKLAFNAPWTGFVFDASRLSTKLASHAPALHSVLRAHADALLAELAPGNGLPQRVRAHILARLRDGGGRAEQAAAELQMTRRTLTRHLQQQGTSFRALVDEVRQRAATNYLQNTDHSVEDIAFLIGFSESPAFVRAFKRWTGMAPSAYRRSLARKQA